jgi:hypothetical protein
MLVSNTISISDDVSLTVTGAGVTYLAGNANPSGAHEFTPQFLVGFVLLDL